jgi:predicted metal-binding membrane protein
VTGWTVREGWTAAALAGVAVVAWGIVLAQPVGMGAGLVVFVVAWTAMMAAMMLPSVLPLVLLYRRGASPGRTALLVMGYLAVWGAAGVPAWIAQELVPMTASPIALGVAGLYQLTPAKQACLVKCRAPADFLMQHWGRGPLRMGAAHGAWCLGCCWALMAVLVIVGMMGLAWVIGLAAVVAVEKLTRRGVYFSRVTGVILLAAAVIQAIQGFKGGM